MDDAKELLPQYLRFVRGIIDSEDLPLNVSREILQQNRVLTSIRTASVKKILSELKNVAANQPEKYLEFIQQYNRPLKEGLLQRLRQPRNPARSRPLQVHQSRRPHQPRRREVAACSPSRRASTTSPAARSRSCAPHPCLRSTRRRTSKCSSSMTTSTRSSSPASTSTATSISSRSTRRLPARTSRDETEPDKAEALKPLLDKLKAILGDRVKDVRASVRLADSPSCIVSDEEEPSLQMQQMLRAMGQKEMPARKPTLEINPDHEIVKKLIARPEDATTEDAAWLLFDQALLMEGVPLKDPAVFVQRLNRVLTHSI